MAATGNVASISVSVVPDLKGFVRRANRSLKDAEKRLKRLKVQIDPVLDEKKTERVEKQLERTFNKFEAKIKANLDNLTAKTAKAGLDAIAHDRVSNIHANVTKSSIGKARKDFQRGLQGETIWANVGAMWKPGTFEPLKRQFFKAFPDLKPWVWPQVDAEHLKKVGADTKAQLSKFGSNYMVYARAGWKKHPKGEVDGLWRKIAPHLKGLRASVGIELKERELTRGVARLAARLKNDAVTYWRFAKDPDSKKKLKDELKALGRIMQSKGMTFKVRPDLDEKDMAMVKARLATLTKGTKHRVRLVLDGYQNLYKLYVKLGLRKAIRWKIQLEFKEAQRALVALKNISTSALKISSIFSALAMVTTSLLGIIGALEKAIVDMAPAFWPLVGIVASFAAGAGIAAVALRNAKTELKALEGPLKRLDKGINKAFWAKAKIPILENANKLIRESEQNVYNLADAMGVFTAGVATGIGNSGDSLRRIIDNASKGFKILSESMRRIIETFLQLVGVGSDFFPVFAGWIDDLSYRFQAWASAIENSEGGLKGWMQDGVDAAFLFGNVIRNLFGIIGDMAEVAAGAGGSLEEFNGKLISIRDLIAEPVFQTGLRNLFTGVRNGSAAVQGALGDLIERLVILGGSVGRLVQQIGELAGAIIDGLGQAFVNSSVVTGITYLAQGLEDVVRAIAPAVAGFTTGLAPVIAGIGDTLSKNADNIALFVQNLSDLALVSFENAGNLAAAILPALLDVANTLLPPLTEFARMLLPAILETLDAVLPVLGEFVNEVGVGLLEALIAVLPAVMALADAVLPALMVVLDALAPLIVAIADALGVGLGTALEVVVPAVELLANVVGGVLVAAFTGLEAIIGVLTAPFELLMDLFNGTAEGADLLQAGMGLVTIATMQATGVTGHLLSGTADLARAFDRGAEATKKAGNATKKANIFQKAWLATKKVAIGVQKAFNAALNANPMTKIIALITLVVGALIWFFTQTETGKKIWEGFVNFLTDSWEMIKYVAGIVWEEIGGYITGFIEWAKTGFTEFINVVVDTWNEIYEGAVEVWNTISSLVTEFVEGVVEAFTAIWEFITEVWNGIVEAATETWTLITELVTGFVEGFIEAFNSIVEFFTEAWTLITETVNTALTFISELWTTVWTGIRDFFVGMWQTIVGFFTGVWETITTTVSTAVTSVQNFITNALNTIKSVWDTIWGGLKTFVTTTWEGIKTTVSGAITAVSKTVESILSSIKGVWESIWTGISNFLSSTWETIKSTAASGIQWVKNKVESGLNMLKSGWESIWGGITTFTEGAWNGLVGFFSGTVGRIGGVFDDIGRKIRAPLEGSFNAIRNLWNSTIGRLSFSIPSWVPGIGGKGFTMPRLAEGGIVTKPTIAMVGEAGDDEAVIPLPKIKPLLADALDSLGVNEGYGVSGGNTYQVSVAVDAKDLRDLRSITEFVDMLSVENRMRMGARA